MTDFVKFEGKYVGRNGSVPRELIIQKKML